MSLVSAYSFAAETAVLVAGPTIILAPNECSCFIASRESSGLVFEFAITRLNLDEEFIFSKYLFTSYSAFSKATFTGFPIDDKEPDNEDTNNNNNYRDIQIRIIYSYLDHYLQVY